MIETIHAYGKDYKVCDGTYYDPRTSDEVIRIVERIRRDGTRCRFHWGDASTGLDWDERYDVCGTIGRSMGPIKVPILIHNSRSMGGGAILDHCMVKITTSRGKRIIYQHPTYHVKPEPSTLASAGV